ncbi:DUF6265 family protein [Sphingobacterium cellulitidis]|uniref:DUF6265 family protein n=1 Tax=Sphingobacterium cellulitidis TaxID=1768011 RepID=UPI001C527742|nr:DUF6265 family protein [Sphingobacterium cellulitidis]
MKILVGFLTLFFFQISLGQNKLPQFLKGHWKVDGSNNQEQWDVLSENNMKGFGYKIVDNLPLVSEYLDIQVKNNELVLTATVLGQNAGKPISFKSVKQDGSQQVKFVNYDHDFPQEISYSLSTDNPDQINVRIAGQGKEQYLKMNRQSAETIKSFDANLAKELGADDYGMKSFYFVVLKTGTNKDDNKELMNEAFKGHMENINRLVKEEKLIVAGPFGKNADNYRGLFILNNIDNEADVKTILETDPAIKSAYLSYSIYKWYGSAALPLYLPFVDQVTKSKL